MPKLRLLVASTCLVSLCTSGFAPISDQSAAAAGTSGQKRLIRSADASSAGAGDGDGGQQLAPINVGPLSENDKIAHLINRITFGARPGDLAAVKAMGLKEYIAAQLNPTSIPENPALNQEVQNAVVLNAPAADMILRYRQVAKERRELKRQQGDGQGQNQNQTAQAGDGGQGRVGKNGKIKNPGAGRKNQSGTEEASKKMVGQQLVRLRIMRALDSNRQLQEVMTDFWYNHFNISMEKGLDRSLVGTFEEQAIRPYALGRFRDLLGSTCYHPAMLFYLDNWQNVKAGATGRKGKVSGINENYARELMELHTLGVDGGYTQKDVQELARVLTGLGLPTPRAIMGGGGNGKWGSFNAANHDFGDKVVVGHKISGSGAGEIDQALDLLARHPSTAHHIAFQLAQYFVADNPPTALVDRLAACFKETDGDIKAVMTSLLDSPEFWENRYDNNKYKSPFRYAISALRATGSRPADYVGVAQFLRLQGEPVYACLTPDGYKNTQAAWLNPDALMNRINFATAIGTGRAKFLTGTPVSYELARDTVNGGNLTPRTEAVIAKASPALKLSLLIGSPEFMRY